MFEVFKTPAGLNPREAPLPLSPQLDLPQGRTWRCIHCGARLRADSIHIAAVPYAHETLALLLEEDGRVVSRS